MAILSWFFQRAIYIELTNKIYFQITWKLFHGKNYSNHVEDKFRLKIFMENKAKIAKHNAAAHRGDKSYFLKMNNYGDLVSYL